MLLKLIFHQEFAIKDMSKLIFFLGLEIGYLTDGIVLTQHKFTRELLVDSDIDLNKKTVTSLPVHMKLTADEGDLLHDSELYRSLVGKLNFLTNTRLDLSYTIQTLSQFLQLPSSHWQDLTHSLRYVGHSVSQGILMRATPSLSLQAFSDSDSCPDTRRSVTVCILLLGNSPITWKSKKQSAISKSSSEVQCSCLCCS